MHKHHQNLDRLCQKLQFRYGSDDDLVMQLMHELGSLDSQEAKKAYIIAMKSPRQRKQDEDEASNPVH
ncbi:MAG: hypothetical protein ABIQ90_15780 [Polaromonas sp.]